MEHQKKMGSKLVAIGKYELALKVVEKQTMPNKSEIIRRKLDEETTVNNGYHFLEDYLEKKLLEVFKNVITTLSYLKI